MLYNILSALHVLAYLRLPPKTKWHHILLILELTQWEDQKTCPDSHSERPLEPGDDPISDTPGTKVRNTTFTDESLNGQMCDSMNGDPLK